MLSSEEEAALRLLRAQYLQLVEQQFLCIPRNDVLIKPDAQEFIYQNVFNENTVWPVPPASYRSRVLKSLLLRLEQSIVDPDEDEVSDNLMGCYSDLVSSPEPPALEQAQKLSYVKYTPPGSIQDPDDHSIITLENRGLILSSGTTGFRTWEAALHLGTFLSTPDGQALVSGKNVVELGAGTGLISMYCIKALGASSVTATDREPALISNIQDCLRRNDLGSRKIRALTWEWGSPLLASDESPLSFEIGLGTDLIYDVDLVPLLMTTLRDLFDNYGITTFIVSATLRNEETFQTFLNACEANSFAFSVLDFQSPPRQSQDGFFHSTDVPIRTYKITDSPSV